MFKQLSWMLIAAMAAVFFTACSTSAPADSTQVKRDDRSIPFTSLIRSPRGGLAQAQHLIIRDEASWRDLGRSLPSRRIPPTPLPQVDFSTQDVVAVFMGHRPTGGFTIEINGILQLQGKVMVKVTEISPGEGCIRTMAQTSPYQLVTVPKLALPVDFVFQSKIHPCK